MLTVKMAFRNILRQKRRTILTILMMLGGFALSSIAIAWSDGTYSRVINMFTRNHLGHIQIHREGYLERPSIYKTIDNFNTIAPELENIPDLIAYTPRVNAFGLASTGDKSAAAQIIGIDPSLEDGATKFSKKISKGGTLPDTPAHETVISDDLAEILKADIGDTIVVVSQAADGSIANDMYTVRGIISSSNSPEARATMYLQIEEAQELFVLGTRIHEIALICTDLKSIPRVIDRLDRTLSNPAIAIDPWHNVARSFYRAMKADQQGSWIMLFIIILVVAVGVLNTVLMSVLERTREYGVLRAIGTSPRQMVKLVLLEVTFMAFISVLLGTVIALGANYLLSIKGIGFGTSLSYGGVTFDRMYTELNMRSYLIPGICVLLTAMIVAVYPAFRAARIEPARALRVH